MQSNSVRLRLTRPEVDELAANRMVSETVHFGLEPEMRLVYRVAAVDGDRVGFEYRSGLITIYLPLDEVGEWAISDRVGFSESIDLGEGGKLDVIVEKDFHCLTDRPAEGDSGTFPHPEASTGHRSER